MQNFTQKHATTNGKIRLWLHIFANYSVLECNVSIIFM